MNANGLVENMIGFNVGVEIGQLIALAVMLAIMLQWRRTASFERFAVAANALILTAGFVLMEYQLGRLFRRSEGMTEGQISKPLPAGRMLAITAGALIVASLVVFGAILPAEFNKDPLGLGRITGLDRLWAPREVEFDTSTSAVPLAREYPIGLPQRHRSRSRCGQGFRSGAAVTSLNTRSA